MHRSALVSVIIASVLWVTACGSSGATAAPVVPASPQAPTSAAAGGAEVDVTLADNTISSTLTTFKAGVPYSFVVKNNGNHRHNFNIAPPASVSGSLDASLAQALLVVTQDQLPVGGGTTVTYTFPASAVGMQLEFSCLIPRHYEDGMRLAITVTN
jgi:uncharacterized cupredoxin-like copper-binding protein